MWFLPVLSSQCSGNLFINSGKLAIKVNDYGWGETIGGVGVYNFIINTGFYNQFYQNNSLKIYLLSFLLLILFTLFCLS